MSKYKIFPFTVGFPYSLMEQFRKADNGGSWFEADLRILSPNSANVVVYGMFDNIWGGRGSKLREVPLFGIEEQLKPYILGRIKLMAEAEIDRQDAEERRSRLNMEASKIADSLNSPNETDKPPAHS